MCRARDVERAAELLEEMSLEPFMRAWPSCPTPGVGNDDDGKDAAAAEADAAEAAAAAWAADASTVGLYKPNPVDDA
jgi:hypothetical protein